MLADGRGTPRIRKQQSHRRSSLSAMGKVSSSEGGPPDALAGKTTISPEEGKEKKKKIGSSPSKKVNQPEEESTESIGIDIGSSPRKEERRKELHLERRSEPWRSGDYSWGPWLKGALLQRKNWKGILL